MMKLNYLNLRETDAEWNLAAEEHVFDALPRDRMYFMLWQNRNAVIVGKYQNTLAEINTDFIREHQIQVVRRLSGGGAVYHDLGNLNYSFIADADPSGRIDLSHFCQTVIRALRSLSIPAELNGRNDMTVDGKKFSGNSQYVRQGRVLHHGTILFDSDLDAVGHALRVDAEKLRTKGVASVRSRVTNLRPYLNEAVSLSDFRDVLLREILCDMPGEEYRLTDEDRRMIDQIKAVRYGTWEWNYGRSPAANLEKRRRIEGCGTVCASLCTDHGRIASLCFSGDFFSSKDPEELAERFCGAPLNAEGLAQALNDTDPGLYLHGISREKLIELLLY